MKYQAKPGFVKRTIAGETLLVPTGAATREFNGMISLNESASYLWDLLKDEKSMDELTAEMCKEFDAPADEIRSDCEAFIANGLKENVISEK